MTKDYPLPIVLQSTATQPMCLDNIQYNERQYLDIYYPSTSIDNPTVIYIHGGSWTTGSKNDTPLDIINLIHRGYNVVSIDYSLSPDNIYPAPIKDLYDAINFVANCDLPIFGNSISLLGVSSGGHLALQYMLHFYSQISPIIDNVIALSAPIDLFTLDEDGGYLSTARDDFLGYTSDSIRREASPYYFEKYLDIYNLEEVRFLLVHGDEDYVSPFIAAKRLTDKMRGYGLNVKLETIIDQGHITDLSKYMNKVVDFLN